MKNVKNKKLKGVFPWTLAEKMAALFSEGERFTYTLH